jgi:hypothetical protein
MSKSTAASAQRNLSLGYATPIVAGVVALILGLIIADLGGQPLNIWVWVVIHLILGAGVVLGTRFSTSAFNYSLTTGNRVGATKGARNLSLILGIIWSSIVVITSFTRAAMAVSGMLVWPDTSKIKYSNNNISSNSNVEVHPHIEPLTSAAFWQDFVPALVLILISIAGIYLLLSERAREPKTD